MYGCIEVYISVYYTVSMQSSFDTYRISQTMGKKVFSARELASVAGYGGDMRTVKVWAKRLKDRGLIRQIKRDCYTLMGENLSNFEYSNALYEPSYISLDSALNYHGILIQVPLSVTAMTLKRAKVITYENVSYDYFHMSPGYFWGYEVINGALIADPEKSLVDKIYLESFRESPGVGFFDELVLDNISKDKLVSYAQRIRKKSFSNLLKEINAKFRTN